ncbi:hypothetical protein R6Q59_033039 [Mikania micrantha]
MNKQTEGRKAIPLPLKQLKNVSMKLKSTDESCNKSVVIDEYSERLAWDSCRTPIQNWRQDGDGCRNMWSGEKKKQQLEMEKAWCVFALARKKLRMRNRCLP